MADVKLNFAIVCDNAFVSQGNNSLNIIGIFDRIVANQFPVIHPRLVLVISVSGNKGSHEQLIVLRSRETGAVIAELRGRLDINNTGQKAQFIGNFFNLIFPSSGEYVFEIKINNELQELKPNIYVG